MDSEELKKRTKKFALEIMEFVESIPGGKTNNVICGQLVRAGTSVAANYRAACRAKSKAHFISKMGDVEEESDESAFWLELLADSGRARGEVVERLLKEANELLAISISSIVTARRNSNKKRF